MSEVCAIILNWNRWRDTVECLDSLLLSKPAIKTIIVCDNGSSDGSREKILAWARKRYQSPSILALEQDARIHQRPSDYPFIYIQNKTNLGFAAGNNIGIRLALSEECFDFIWLLNNDTTIHERAVKTLLTYAKDHPGTGIFGSTVVFAARVETVQCAGGCRYNPLTTIFRPALGGENLDKVLAGNNSPRLDYIYGASMFVRAEVFERIGLLNEEYFLFYEELDFCQRCKRAGFEIGWCLDSIVYHKNSKTIGQPGSTEKGKVALANYHENLSTLIYTRRFHPRLLPFAGTFRFFGKLAFIAKRKDWYLIRPLLRAYYDFFK
ncbi:MAG: glycosyltransferase family 2 protein [Thermodesulfobacteriota bacterium]|nr:glycosyltransferase family 2 protein [Thermodesulfobacteriota bacterium]